jgi:hypothetical protein
MIDRPDLDKLEAKAVQALEDMYKIGNDDFPARFWTQKGIEGMRMAISEWWFEQTGEYAKFE